MLGTKVIDNNKKIDCGKTSKDYASFRPSPPLSLFKKLLLHKIGMPKQRILDLGTGTGVMARQFAKQESIVTGIDISPGQIKQAKECSQQEKLDIEFFVSSVEDLSAPNCFFDVITANQCFLYFHNEKALKNIFSHLMPNGLFMISHFSWLPFDSPIAKATENLILRFNPDWAAHSYVPLKEAKYEKLSPYFNLKHFFSYKEDIAFTHESWRGRIRASRGIGASLEDKKIAAFDKTLEMLLIDSVPKNFTVPHSVDAHIFSIEKGE